MEFVKNFVLMGVFLLVAWGVAGCSSGQEPAGAAAIANPASEHCVKKGGKVEIVREEAGEKGMCHLPDGTVVEEWELFRKDNPEG